MIELLGSDAEWRITKFARDYADGGTLDLVIATDLLPGTEGVQPTSTPPNWGQHDIVLSDLHDIIPDGHDFVSVRLGSNHGALPGSLDGEPGAFSCSHDNCYLTDTHRDGNYSSWVDGLVFTPDDGSNPINVDRTMWNPPRAADYLAFGYWVYVPENPEQSTDYQFGVFGTVGDLFTTTNLRGLEGSATYSGDAAGMYFVDRLSDSPTTGAFTADVELTADFGTSDETGMITGAVDNFAFQSAAHSAMFPEAISLGTAEGWVADRMEVPRDTSNIFDADWNMYNPGGFAQGWTYAEPDGVEWHGTWWGQFHGDGAQSTDHPAGIAGTFGSHLAIFDEDGNWVGGPADRGLAGGFAARRQDDQL